MASSEEECVVNVNKNWAYYIYHYFQEFLEALVAIAVYAILTETPGNTLNLHKILKISAIFGAISLFLEEYNPNHQKMFKTGMIVGIGGKVLKT
jgi:hypothetical protein